MTVAPGINLSIAAYALAGKECTLCACAIQDNETANPAASNRHSNFSSMSATYTVCKA